MRLCINSGFYANFVKKINPRKMKKYLLFLTSIFILTTASGQEQKTLKLTPEEIESIFLKENLELIAEKMNVSIADAGIVQAKLWDNPNFSISNVNLWGSSVKNTEFNLELSQLIQTANKRGKLIAREKAAKEITIQAFEETLRGLKIELRQSVNDILYLESYLKVLNSEAQLLSQLITAYNKQVMQGNLSKNELLRLQSALFAIDSEIYDTQTELNGKQKDLRILLNAVPSVTIEIVENETTIRNSENLLLSDLIELALESRPDIKSYKMQMLYHEKSLAYERAQRVPDLTLSAQYDRFGGVWKDFTGFGISFDLPVFNRNQGNIKAAKISLEQNQYLALQQEKIAQNEVAEAYNNYTSVYNFYRKINENDLLKDLDNMLDVYAKNLLNKNISMLEFIDFMDTYKNNKQIVLSTRKNVRNQFEELQFVVGAEIPRFVRNDSILLENIGGKSSGFAAAFSSSCTSQTSVISSEARNLICNEETK